MTLDIIAHILRLSPALDGLRRWCDAAARLIRDGREVAERMRRERRERTCVSSCINCGWPGAHNIDEDVFRWSKEGDLMCPECGYTCGAMGGCPECAGGEMACTTGDPVAMDEEERALFEPKDATCLAGPAGDLTSVCGKPLRRGKYTCSRSRFTADPHRCPECYRRLFPEVDS